ncbi:hypothetical protein BKA70DRAFT_1219440 [Coprinopsis sp. MPI-PUGE-AT-0042]|nr:hypothetical protein BKA70DRAFT_1219440 [Coprinopsis sp. MPI-PUGE-AT-0042]
MIASRRLVTAGPLAQAAIISGGLSVSMNVMVTGLILFQLWKTWSFMSKACLNQKRPSMYSNVAAMMIESAAPLAVFGVCWVTVTAISYHGKPERLFDRGVLNSLAEVSESLYNSFSALSPQMIIFRVLNGQSWRNAREGNEQTEKFSQPLRFVRDTPDSNSSDNSIA